MKRLLTSAAIAALFATGSPAASQSAPDIPVASQSAFQRIPSVTGQKVQCANGKAGAFECSNVDLLSYLSITDMGGASGTEVS